MKKSLNTICAISMLITHMLFLNAKVPSGYIAVDSDIVGAYRVMTGKPIATSDFLYYKSLKDANKWTLQHLGQYLFSLPETKKYLKMAWNPVFNFKEKTVDPASRKYSAQELVYYQKMIAPVNNSPSMTMQDVVAAYRVFLGQPITKPEYEFYKRFKGSKNFKSLAVHLMAQDEAHDNLNIPLLNDIGTFSISLKNGMTLFGYQSDYVIAATIARTKSWEPHMELLMRKIIKPGSTVIDVGANIGYDTVLLAELVGKTGTVHAFEPVVPLAYLVEQAKKVNNLGHVHVHNCALSNKQGYALIKINTVSPGISKFLKESEVNLYNTEKPGRIVKVPTYVLDQFLGAKKLARLDYIKIDVEGAEPLVLEGAMQLIKQFHPKITWEFNLGPYKDYKIDALKSLQAFQKLGYHFAFVHDIAGLPNPESYSHGKWLSPEQLIAIMNKKGLIQADIFLG